MQDAIQFYSPQTSKKEIHVRVQQENVWLSLQQMAELFERDKSVISRHLKRIFAEELERDSVVAFFATTARDEKTYQVEYYNLDAILSVGYRVNSRRGIEFRRWASKVLQDHLLKGYSLHEERLAQRGLKELESALSLLSQTLKTHALMSDIGTAALSIIQHYAKTWHTLLAYDENRLSAPEKLAASDIFLSEEEAKAAIVQLKHTLIEVGEASALFGQEREHHFAAILGSLAQTFGGTYLYPTAQERAAHLLYFAIKDHPFTDGNKRIGSFLFLLYLQKLGLPYGNITDAALVALSLLIAESPPQNKDLMIRLIVHLLVG